MSPLLLNDPSNQQGAFTIQPHGHKDMVEAVAYNDYGTRFAVGCADGKVKVYDRNRDGSWTLCDTWGAHNAEIVELHWLPSTIHPNLIASIATDGMFKIWVEDSTLPKLSGRRFNSRSNRPIYEMRSPQRAPYLSFAIKHDIETKHTFLALLDRSAMLTVYENEEPEDMRNWSQIDQFLVCEKPALGEETSFKVRFDPNLEPCFAAIREGVPRESLGIIVAGANTARIWRTKIISHENSLGSGSSKEFYRAADLPGHKSLVRDVAWAAGSVRGYDICATVSKDGFLRVYEIRTPPKDNAPVVYGKYPTSNIVVPVKNLEGKGPSGIGAGLATVRSGPVGNRQQDGLGQVTHVVTEVARLQHSGPLWRVSFDADGQMIGTTADDGKLRLWRRKPDGQWCQNGELAMVRG